MTGTLSEDLFFKYSSLFSAGTRSQSLSRLIVGLLLVSFHYQALCVDCDYSLPEHHLRLVEISHTNLTEVTRVVLVHVGSVVVLTTGKTTTTGVLSVLSDTTVTGRDVAAVLAGLGEAGRL